MRTLGQSQRQWRRHCQGWYRRIGLGLLHQDCAHCCGQPRQWISCVRSATTHAATQPAVAAAALAVAAAAFAQPAVTRSVLAPAATPGHAVCRHLLRPNSGLSDGPFAHSRPNQQLPMLSRILWH